jgi:hypothetical protein
VSIVKLHSGDAREINPDALFNSVVTPNVVTYRGTGEDKKKNKISYGCFIPAAVVQFVKIDY